MSNQLECILQCEPGAYMVPLSIKEYAPAGKTDDGTKKWFKCGKCGGIYCLDKMTRTWQFAAETYTELVEKGLLNDYLE